jgi:hypothetical protein
MVGGSNVDLALRSSHGLQRRSSLLSILAVFGTSLFLAAAIIGSGDASQPTAYFPTELDEGKLELESLQTPILRRLQEPSVNDASMPKRQISLAEVTSGNGGASAAGKSKVTSQASSSSASACKHRVPVRYSPYFACEESSSSSGQLSADISHEKELIAKAEDSDNKEAVVLAKKLVKDLATAEMNADGSASSNGRDAGSGSSDISSSKSGSSSSSKRGSHNDSKSSSNSKSESESGDDGKSSNSNSKGESHDHSKRSSSIPSNSNSAQSSVSAHKQ